MRIGWLMVMCSACASSSSPTATIPGPAAESAPQATSEPPPAPLNPLVARTVDTVDHVFGLDVPDPYRWMETADAERDAWLLAQGSAAAKALAALPGRAELYARIHELDAAGSLVGSVQRWGGSTLYMTRSEDAQVSKLVARDSQGHDRVLVDPALRGSDDSHAALDGYSLSPDGKLVAYNISTGGGEVGEIRVMSVATGKDLPDVETRIWGELAAQWLPDSKGFFYTQMAVPAHGVDPMFGMTPRFHRLGDPIARDINTIPQGSVKIAPAEFPMMWQNPGSPWAILSLGGAHSEARDAIGKAADAAAGKATWQPISELADGIENAFVHGDRIYLQTFHGAPNRRLISVPIAHPDLAAARIEIPEAADATIDQLNVARDAVYFTRGVSGKAQLFRWPWHGAAERIALPADGWVYDLQTTTAEDGATFQLQTWLAPATYYRVTRKVVPLSLQSTSPVSFADIAVDDVEVGDAKVPLTIIHRKGTALDGTHPTIVNGYGGYGYSLTPYFDATRLAWLERGGVIAYAHVRGGGEKGRHWQDDGSHANKLNGIRDLIACASYLVDQKWTTHGRIALEGASAGGILIGRTLVEQPDVAAAVHISVGMVNPLRILAEENGANQETEVGDPTTETGYKDIYAMDPYAHVKAHTAYPAVLFTIGLHDHRVAPWETAKMAARLLAATSSDKPILVRVEGDAGHGMGSTRDQRDAETADVWSFMLAHFQ
ncbi:MAG TPA: prolyl oligopeptidase family serine peptidase [Kofleriaceae bacterium]